MKTPACKLSVYPASPPVRPMKIRHSPSPQFPATPGLIPNPTVNYTSANTTGSLTFTPVSNGYGTATITVTVNDGGTSNNIVTRTFTVTVNAVNQPPTLNAINNLSHQ
jgi:hypothetical protein